MPRQLLVSQSAVVDCACSQKYETIAILDRARLVSDQSGLLFPDWFGGIHLACQSQVCEMQHFITHNLWWRNVEREGTFIFALYSFQILLSSALSLYSVHIVPRARTIN